jgi:glycosyltransferase involved in cell wall biosynthesis
MDSPRLSVIIPTLNEAKRIPLALLEIDRRLSAGDYSYEILVVDRGSNDATTDIVRRFASFVKNLNLLEQPDAGWGEVLKKGMLSATGQYRMWLDLDSEIDFKELPRLLEHFRAGFGAVVGYPGVEASDGALGFLISLPSSFWKKAAHALVTRKVRNGLSGFQCFTGAAAEIVFPKTRLKGRGAGLEALGIADKNGIRIGEVNLDRRCDATGGKSSSAPLWDAVKIKIWLLAGAYK